MTTWLVFGSTAVTRSSRPLTASLGNCWNSTVMPGSFTVRMILSSLGVSVIADFLNRPTVTIDSVAVCL